MIIKNFVWQTFKIVRNFYGGTKKTTKKRNINNELIKSQQISQKIDRHKQRTMKIYQQQPDIDLANQVKQLNLKDFSVRIHHLLRQKQKSPLFWSSVEQQFQMRLQPTKDPVKIRSYSKIIYSLSKSKKSTANYETKMSIILPFATPQSFTTIVTSLSRIAPLSQEMSYIIQKLYYKRKSEFRPRQIVSINYTLSNNGRKCDKQMIHYLDHFNAVQTITMLRCYDKSEQMTPKILKTGIIKLKSLQNELNVLDLSDMINIYLKYDFITKEVQILMKNSYHILKRNIDDICLEKIWKHMPEAINKGKLNIKFIENVISTIQILRKSQNMSQIIWKNIKPTFQTIENIELKLRLEKIY